MITEADSDENERRCLDWVDQLRHIDYELVDSEEQGPMSGHFSPWGLLHQPEDTTGFRFVYPILLVVSWTTAYLYDVRMGEMVQEIVNLQNTLPDYSGSCSSTSY